MNMEFGLLHEESEILFVEDLDAWFTNVYRYWHRKGFASELVLGSIHIFTLAFTIIFSTFLFAFVNWTRLRQCKDEDSCDLFDNYIRRTFLTDPDSYGQDILALTYIGVFGLYWLWSCGATWFSLREAWEIGRFYEIELKISPRELQTLRWNEVVFRLGCLQKQGRAPWKAFQTAGGAANKKISVGDIEMAANRSEDQSVDANDEGALITAHDIACRIMRKENYLIAMLNANILDLTLPLPELLVGRFPALDTTAARARLTKTLEWSLHSCLLDHIFSRRFVVRRAFLDDEVALSHRFVWAGLIHVALVPFVAAFMTMHFFLLHAQEWHNKRRYLGPREWSPVAQWSFRELNELPHCFETRLAASRGPADTYLKLFPQPITTALARCVAFVSGAIVAVLLVLAAALDGGDSVLLYIKLGERNLLWYAGAASAAFAIARAFVPSEAEESGTILQGRSAQVDFGKKNRTATDGMHLYASPGAAINVVHPAEVVMRGIAEHTHCFPEEWRGKAHTHEVCDAFSRAFRYKVWLFFDEVMSIFFAPIILCFSLSSSASTIIQFVRDNTVDVNGLGSVLGHSLFDFDTYGNAKYGSPTEGVKPTECGKMEKSFLNFTLNYPEWVDGDERSKRFLLHIQRCASTPGNSTWAEYNEMNPIDNEMSSHLGLSFERLDQYAASMREVGLAQRDS